MDEEDQIAADFAPGPHDVPESVLSSGADNYYPGADFDNSQAFLHGEGTDEQAHLAAVQAAHDKIQNWLSTFHGAEPADTRSLQRQVASGKISSADYFAQTGRVYSGGDVATRGDRGNITGYTSPDGSGTALGGGSGTPGLDNLHAMQDTGFSPVADSPLSMPASVSAHVGAPSPGLASAVDTLTYDTRLQTPTKQSIQGPKSSGNTRSLSADNKSAAAAWAANQKSAQNVIRGNARAVGLLDPTIAASTLNLPGGGSMTLPGNMGQQSFPSLPSSVSPWARR